MPVGNDTMNESQFFDWLCEKYTGGTPKSRLANCKRVEQYEGDLDSHFSKDQGLSLIWKLPDAPGQTITGCCLRQYG